MKSDFGPITTAAARVKKLTSKDLVSKCLAQYPQGLTVSEIATKMGMMPNTVYMTLRFGLEEKGQVTRQKRARRIPGKKGPTEDVWRLK